MGQMLGGLMGPGQQPGGYSADQLAGSAGMNVPFAGIGGPSMGDLMSASGGMQGLQDMAMQLGDTPDERKTNAQAFAKLVAQLGSMSKDIAGSTIMQRVMQGRIRPIMAMPPTGGGGVAAMPTTFSPDMAQSIMSRMGYK